MIVRQVKDSIHNKKKILPLSPQRVTNKIMHGVVEQTHMKKIFQQKKGDKYQYHVKGFCQERPCPWYNIESNSCASEALQFFVYSKPSIYHLLANHANGIVISGEFLGKGKGVILMRLYIFRWTLCEIMTAPWVARFCLMQLFCNKVTHHGCLYVDKPEFIAKSKILKKGTLWYGASLGGSKNS